MVVFKIWAIATPTTPEKVPPRAPLTESNLVFRKNIPKKMGTSRPAAE